jgi:hypothetical protein
MFRHSICTGHDEGKLNGVFSRCRAAVGAGLSDLSDLRNVRGCATVAARNAAGFAGDIGASALREERREEVPA